MRTLNQAIRAANRRARSSKAPTPGTYSCWQTTVHSKGKATKGPWRHNLVTTTASGYTCALDWLAKTWLSAK